MTGEHTIGDPHPAEPGLYRIVAGRDIPRHGVYAGDVGGWVADLRNVRDDAWVSGDAILADTSTVTGWARVGGTARVEGDSHLTGAAVVTGKAYVGESTITDRALVYDQAAVDGCHVSGNVCLSGDVVARYSHLGGRFDCRDGAVVIAAAWLTDRAHLLRLTGLPSGSVTLVRTLTGHRLAIGCWSGTTDALRGMIAKDAGWPSATGADIPRRRPGLAALADLCDAHMTTWSWDAPPTQVGPR